VQKNARAGNDPKATNMLGQKFDIQRLGTFTFLNYARGAETLMKLDATVARAGPTCDHTYILNLTMTGSFLQHAFSIRAAPHVAVQQSMEVLVNGEWRKLYDQSKFQKEQTISNLSSITVNNRKISIDVHGLKLTVSANAHRIQDSSLYANFLDIELDGLTLFASKEKSGVLTGLLAFDDHTFAEQAPEDCKKSKRHSLKMGSELVPHMMMSMANVLS